MLPSPPGVRKRNMYQHQTTDRKEMCMAAFIRHRRAQMIAKQTNKQKQPPSQPGKVSDCRGALYLYSSSIAARKSQKFRFIVLIVSGPAWGGMVRAPSRPPHSVSRCHRRGFMFAGRAALNIPAWHRRR